MEGGVAGGGVAAVVEDEELGFGAAVTGVGEAGRLEVGFGFAGDAAGGTVVGFAGEGVFDVADEAEGGVLGEGVDEGGGGVGHDEHVGGLNALPPAGGGN